RHAPIGTAAREVAIRDEIRTAATATKAAAGTRVAAKTTVGAVRLKIDAAPVAIGQPGGTCASARLTGSTSLTDISARTAVGAVREKVDARDAADVRRVGATAHALVTGVGASGPEDPLAIGAARDRRRADAVDLPRSANALALTCLTDER